MRGGQQRDRGREEGEAPGGGVEGHRIIRGTRRDVHVPGEARRVAVHDDDENNDKDVDEDVSGCPEALLPGALTRRLSACRPRLTLPPSSSSHPTSHPPAPPSYLRLALSVRFSLSPFSSYFFLFIHGSAWSA